MTGLLKTADTVKLVIKKRRKYFKAVVEAFDGQTFVCSPQNIIEYVNQRAIDDIGENIIGEYCFKAIYDREEICPWCQEQEVFQGKTIRWEHQRLTDGRWYHCMSSPVYHSDGSISKLTLVSDITEKKQAEKALNESERRLETLMGNLPGMAYRCRADEAMTMEFASDGCYKLLGYRPSDLVGRSGSGSTSYKDLILPQDRENLLENVRAALAEKRSFSFIYRVQTASGENIWVWEQGEGIFSQTGELTGLEGFITNVTDHKNAELDLRKENVRLKNLSKDRYRFGSIVGKSAQMQAVYELIVKASSNDVNVTVSGESGTGKELVAKTIHRLSDRKAAPFVTVNCGAINENLVESEFFGYKKGAFTGAVGDSIGYLEKADQGILFLDELGETSKSMQIKLLRAIESKEFIPVGGNEIKTSDFRIVSATHRNLSEAVKNKAMREDFYYRIHILPIHLPPLRERKEDIPLLIDHFIDVYPTKESEKPSIPADIRAVFQTYDWPGNVRQLKNAVYRYIALGQIDIDTRQLEMKNELKKISKETDMMPGSGLTGIMTRLEKKIIENALLKFQWNRGKTARYLNIDRKTLYRKIKSLGLVSDD